ncbi:hypothetical protein CU097_008730 [Rhizopus azygosporus]|uniref:Uncharacterized protein n=1 Tax=Rhizopus azygosporus TaxID=86630 RepID=A0A367K5Z6_RHIAZ|nr:hypothetical protein CU097_008730 [Rhizopus azygosporus]
MQQGLVFAHPNDLRMTNFSRLPKLGNQLSGTTASFPSTDPQPFVFFDQVCHLSTTVINNMPTAIPPIEAAPPAAITLFDKRAATMKELFTKEAIELVQQPLDSPGFIIPMFTIPKKTGDCHPLFNL